MTDCQSKVVIFTDLDGTLLDLVTYSYDKALPAIEYLRERGVPLIFCSSKTRAEQEFYYQQLGIPDPFIVKMEVLFSFLKATSRSTFIII